LNVFLLQTFSHQKISRMDKSEVNKGSGRREFIGTAGRGLAALTMLPGIGMGKNPDLFTNYLESPAKVWVPVTDRKIRVGLVGYGASKFSAAFGFQNHPNVEIVAVSDLFPERCAELAARVNCKKTYPSLEELVKDDTIEAVFVATDAPSHARHTIEVLKHGKHVAVAVPAVFGSLEEGQQVFEMVKRSPGLKYMMFETSCFREELYAMRQIFNAGGFGKLVYSEGEYYHGASLNVKSNEYKGIGSYNNWRQGIPPQWYPTHNNAFYIGVTGCSFTEVSCFGVASSNDFGNNRYNNPFDTEIALYKTSEGGTSRQAVSWATPGTSTEIGRVRGTEGSFDGKYEGRASSLPNLERPPLPPGVSTGGHGGSHGQLMNEFVLSILEDRKPLVDIVSALNMTIPGIVAHDSAMNDGKLMKIPQFIW
jgi:predicted dehydrogenase